MTDPRTLAAREILEKNAGGAVAISKTVRAGMTTSAVFASEAMGKRLLVLAPTTRILKETVGNASGGSVVRVPGNSECAVLAKEIAEYPLLELLPMSLPNCDKCEGYNDCVVTQLLRNPDAMTIGMTIAKARALMLSEAKAAKEVRSILQKVDFVLLDEAHVLGFESVASVPATHIHASDTPALKHIEDLWNQLVDNNQKTIQELQGKGSNGPAARYLAVHSYVANPLSWKSLSAAWAELRRLAKTGVDSDTLILLRDAIDVLSHPWCVIHYVTEDEGTSGKVMISGSRGKSDRAITEFLQNVVPFAGHIYTSGTMIEPHEGYFAELSGKPVGTAVFPDTQRSSASVTLIPDSWSLNAGGFSRKLDAIVGQIQEISAIEHEPIYCFCQSVEKAITLRSKLKELGVHNVRVDWYRSDMSIGVARGERVCIGVGMAELPANALDPLAWGKTELDRWMDSRRLRKQAIHAATWQSVNRVRDPSGTTPSRIYMIGVRMDDVRQLATWGPNRQVTVSNVVDSTMVGGSIPFRQATYNVTVDSNIEECKIMRETTNKSTKKGYRVKLTKMIDKIELYNVPSINSQNAPILPIISYRENGGVLRFYNYPSDESEFAQTVSTLYNVFVHRNEVYARQFRDQATGKWMYHKMLHYVTRDVMESHVKGDITIGTYEIGLDDDVTWGCFDVDSHDSGDDGTIAREKVVDLCDVMDVYCVPYILEASGSPGSYHIWVFFRRTKTLNAYWFMRQIAKEAKVKEIEIWPKQKKLDKNGKYGNLVKMPLGINRKTGVRSCFLNPDFEPLDGAIEFPGRVVLIERDEYEMPRAKPVKAVQTPTELDYCMTQCLASDEPLTGSEGHLLRVAIATKAAVIGMSPEATAMLFAHLPDYDYEFSLKKAEEIGARGYSPWSCQKLRDSCGDLVGRWCNTCPFGRRLRLEVLA